MARRIKRTARPAGSSVELDYKDKKTGKMHRARLHARVIEPILKQEGEEERDSKLDIGASQATEGEFNRLLRGDRSNLLIQPPFDLRKLVAMREISTELGQDIDAMVTNTVGFGWQLRERKMGEADRARLSSQVEAEAGDIEARLDSVHPIDSFTSIMEQVKQDKHQCGNGYLELIDNKGGELVGLSHVHGHTIRLTVRDKKPTRIMVPRVRPDKGFIVEQVPMLYKFRRFVQVRNQKLVWFKEAPDSRFLDSTTGEFSDTPIDMRKRATSLIHFSIYNVLSPYGVPLWIGNTFSVHGSREADHTNYITLLNNSVPSMFVIVENGALTGPSVDRLREFIESQVQLDANFSKAILLEGETIEEGAPNPGQFRIRVEPLAHLQHTDQLMQNYDANNRDKIRQSFRLPPILVGRCHSADTEYLTDGGWKKFSDVGSGALLGTVNPASGAVEYQKPTASHSYQFDGELLHLKNRGIDALVTPNHRMWTRPTSARSKSEKPWRFVDAEFLCEVKGGNSGCLELPVSASWEGEELDVFRVPRNDGQNSWDPSKPSKNPARDTARYESRATYDVPGDAFVRFVGYFVAEGSTTETPGPIVLSQNEGLVAEEMKDVVRWLGFEPTVVESRPNELNISFSHVGLWEWLRENCGTSSATKKLPVRFLHLSQRQMELLLDAMVDGDGHLSQLGSSGSFSYSTVSRLLNDQLHVICLKLGIAFTSRRTSRSEDGWLDIYRSYGHYERRHLIRPKAQIDRVHYNGQVSCFTVPNGLLVTRRNGRVLISGNSELYNRATADTSRDIADEQVFAPERTRDDHPINRFVLGRWGSRFHTFRHRNPNITDDIELIRLMAIAEKSGAMTPRRADRIIKDVFGDDIGPMPKGIDLDQPFTITFAQAQQGAGQETQEDVAQKMIDGLLDLRGRIEKELDERWEAAA